MDCEHGKGRCENGNASLQQENADTNVTVVLDELHRLEQRVAPKSGKQTPSCSAPSSSNTLEEDDLFQIDAGELGKPMKVLDEIPRNNSRPPPGLETSQSKASLSDSTKHESNDAGTPQGVVFAPAGIALSYDATSALGSINVSIARGNQCPSPSPYGSDVPAPNRIPSSVFARTKSTTPMEWSVTSNESLFSIHMGKSGDLSSLYSGQFDGYPPLSPEFDASSLKDAQGGSNLQRTIDAEATKDAREATAEKRVEEDRPPTVNRTSSSNSESQFSDGGSAKSYRSFAFPILAGDSTNGSLSGQSAVRPLEKAQLQPPVPQTPPQSTEPPNAEPVASKKSRLPCFSCCSFCR